MNDTDISVLDFHMQRILDEKHKKGETIFEQSVDTKAYTIAEALCARNKKEWPTINRLFGIHTVDNEDTANAAITTAFNDVTFAVPFQTVLPTDIQHAKQHAPFAEIYDAVQNGQNFVRTLGDLVIIIRPELTFEM